MTRAALIPYPELTRRYVTLKEADSSQRLTWAEQATVCEYVDLISESIRAFEAWPVSADEPFYPANDARDLDKSPKQHNRTFGWAMALRGMAEPIEVIGDSGMKLRYVAREVSPVHTKPKGSFETDDGRKNSTDLILVDHTSGRPVVAELKIGGDKEPFTALVQALAAGAQLVPKQQRHRLCALDTRLAGPDEEPRIDVLVLLAEFPERNRHRWEQLAYAHGLASGLQQHPAIRRHFRRIGFLQLSRDAEDQITATSALPEPPVSTRSRRRRRVPK